MSFVWNFRRQGDLLYRRRLVELHRRCHRDDCLLAEFFLRRLRSRATAEAIRHSGRRNTIRPEPCATLDSARFDLYGGRTLAPLDGLVRSRACATIAGFARETHFSPTQCPGWRVFQGYASSRPYVVLGKLTQADGTVCVSEAKEFQPSVAG